MKEIAYKDITQHGRLRLRSKLTWSDPYGDWDWLEFDVGQMTKLKNGRAIHRWLKRCTKCNSLFSIQPCENCGGTKLRGVGMPPKPGMPQDSESPDGIGCIRCNKGRVSWNCSTCGIDNLYEGTITSFSSRLCYIATAACDPEDAPLLDVLYLFRDKCLMRMALGRLFVATYNYVSPPIAQLIRKSSTARRCTRFVVVRPAAYIAGKLIAWIYNDRR